MCQTRSLDALLLFIDSIGNVVFAKLIDDMAVDTQVEDAHVD